MDLMASTASAQRPPTTSRQTSKTLPFYSRYHTDGTSGIDVLAQDVSKKPDPGKPCFGFCLTPLDGGGAYLPHPSPDRKATRFPLLWSALVRTQMVETKADPNVFFKVHHSRGTIPVVFQ